MGKIKITEDQTIHHPFKLPEYHCQICGSDNELAHVWKCEKHEVIGNAEFNCPYCVQEEEEAVQ
jgi:hypothetical protein